MTWHRADGGHDTSDERAERRAARRPVTPLPMSLARAIVRGAAALTLGAGIAAGAVLLATMVLGLVAEELTGNDLADLVARGSMAGVGALAVVAAIGEPLRRVAERALLLRAAEARPEGAPPHPERTAIQEGPHGLMLGSGVGATIVGGIVLPIGLLLAADDREALLARILVPTVAAAVLALGIVLLLRGRKAARGPWARRASAVAGDWGGAVQSVPRIHSRRAARVVGVAATLVSVGFVVFMVGVFLRQPGRWADRVEWDETGELAIDGFITTGAIIIGIGTAGLLVLLAGMLLWRSIQDARTVRALERGERVLLQRVDAILLDRSAMEQSAMVLGVAGWMVFSYAWAPPTMAWDAEPEQIAALAPLAALALPGLGAVALAWLLGTVGALRVRARRARVQAALLRDPRPGEHAGSEHDRRADAVRDILVHGSALV